MSACSGHSNVCSGLNKLNKICDVTEVWPDICRCTEEITCFREHVAWIHPSSINLPCWNVNNLSMQTGLCSWGLDSRSITRPAKKRHGAMASFNHAVPVESWTVGGLEKGTFVADVWGG